MTILRPYQSELCRQTRAAWAGGARYVMNVLATGGGKTLLLADQVQHNDGPSCTIVHRQELLSQISCTYATAGVRHNIIAPQPVINSIIAAHVADHRRSFYDPKAPATVAGVDTLIRRYEPGDPWCNSVRLWCIDECFVAGTLVDNTPIEKIQAGDIVTGFDERSNTLVRRKVNRVFKRPAPVEIYKVATSHHVLYVTKEHPFWTKRGWVVAGDINNDDELLTTSQHGMFHVRRKRQPKRSVDVKLSENQETILFTGMRCRLSSRNIIQDDGKNKQSIRVQTNERTKPDVETGCQGQSIGETKGNRTYAEGARRKRRTTYESGNEACGDVRSERVYEPNISCYRMVEKHRTSGALQDRLCAPEIEDRHRGRRVQSHGARKASIRCQKRQILTWQRVESVSVLERDNPEIPGDGYVYNIEVDDVHTYTANGVVVHNCHHALTAPANKWGKATQLFPHSRGLGVTATPLRADNRSLHIDQGGAFDTLIQGPSMRDLIEAGSLCDYRVLAPEPSINEAMLRVGSTGDFTDRSVKAATKAELTGDIVRTYQQHTPGKQAIVFTTGVEQSKIIATAFQQAGITARALDGNTPDAERTTAVRSFGRGDIKILVNTGLFDEGFDVPAVEVTIMARPTMSFGLFCQQIGRCLRPAPGKRWGVVIDHVGNVLRMAATHGMPDTPRRWGLWRDTTKRAARNPDALPVRVCAECSLTYPAIQFTCPYCGHAHTPAGRDAPEQVDGVLAEMSPELLDRLRMARAQVWRDAPAIPYNAAPAVVAGIQARHRKTQQAHHVLADAMEQWGGVRRAAGDTDEQMQARFLHRFGVDVLTAQTLPRGAAVELVEAVRDALSG